MYVVDIDQSRVEVDLSYVPSLASLETFATYLHQYTTAKVESITLHTTKYLDGLEESLGDYKDLDLKGVIGMKNYTPDAGEYPFRQYHLPGHQDLLQPLDDIFFQWQETDLGNSTIMRDVKMVNSHVSILPDSISRIRRPIPRLAQATRIDQEFVIQLP